MDLFDTALRVRANAHAPYSGFKVGAAIRCPDGSVFAGCNVENVAYPQGTCAEAGAIAAMVAAGGTAIAEALVVADGPELVTPCGGCRQRLAEFAPPATPVILADPRGERARSTVGQLLPGAFGPAHLAGDAP
jgi:cytidine deaminase